MSKIDFDDKIKGCLTGAAIGAELAFQKFMFPERFPVRKPEDTAKLRLEKVGTPKEEPGRVVYRSCIPFIDIGIRAYLQKKGRVTPEDFGGLLQDDESLAGPVFTWDGLHSTQEVLREGMNPRISALGATPSGLICPSMIAVGTYHCGNPEYAYLDGVELASVVQPRMGADWAALCAAAIACAFQPGVTPKDIPATVLKIVHRHAKEVFYQLNEMVMNARGHPEEEDFLAWWLCQGAIGGNTREMWWYEPNPLLFVLPLLIHYGDSLDGRRLLTALVAPDREKFSAAAIAGAIAGAIFGPDTFPGEWRKWAEPIAKPWFPMAEVVKKRISEEKQIITGIRSMQKIKKGNTSILEDKVHGCILAGAIGNAMGSAAEGMFYWEIDKKHPGGIKTVLDPARLEGEDDNQMAMHLVETYLKADGGPVMARQFGERWKEYLNRDHFFPSCIGNAYDLICAGWDARITGHWIQVTGSTVMCMEPVGIYHACDPQYAMIDATAISYMYQRGLDVTTAALLAAATAEAMKPKATVRSICDAVLSLASREPLKTFDKRTFKSVHQYLETCLEIAAKYTDVFASRAELYKKCLFYHHIDPLELFGLSLAMLVISKGDVRQAAIGGTNIGRDADTIAGRAAMLAGTLHGAGSVPKDWIALFTPEALKRIETNARRFTSLVAGKKLESLVQRQKIIT
ncbi:MAG: ADP-ribosylglycohydrolase family protein [Candidatus Omnitrophota bacterium]